MMDPLRILRRFLWAAMVLLFIVTIGTTVYWVLGEGRYSVLDSLYMTVITITTIGFGEIVDLSQSPAGRIFTMIIAFSGIGFMTYILLNVTSFVIEGQFNEAFLRKKMEKRIGKMKNHHIVCGIEGVGAYIINEMQSTKRPFVVIDPKRERIDKLVQIYEDLVFVDGDATENDVLTRAGIAQAAGLFAVTGDDNMNLVISLTAKQMNPRIRVIVRCEDLRNTEKMKKVGADAIVSPTYIGGLRMASEMLRPAVVSFLDIMLRQVDENLRIEEVKVPENIVGKPLSALRLKEYSQLLLMAVNSGGRWVYNPPRSYVMAAGDVLIYMGSPEERQQLERDLGGSGQT